MNQLPVVPEDLYEIVAVEDPQLSPDGQTVAFVRMRASGDANAYRRSIWLAPADGGMPAWRFSRGGAQDFAPRWSPDGQRLCFLSDRAGSPQLFVARVDGGEPQQLTLVFGGVSHPAWSPDGQTIAFNANVTADERALEDAGAAYDPDLRAAVDAWREEHRADLRDPRVISKLPYRTGKSFFDGLYQHVYVVPAAGGAPRRLSHGDFHHSAPDWTPDSGSVVTNSNREQSSGEEYFELWSSILRYDVETGQEETVAFEVSEEGRPVRISPDGNWLAYSYVRKVESPYQDQYYLAVSALEGGDPIVTSAESEITVADFRWDTDSEHLLLVIHDQGQSKLARIHRDGGQPQILLDGPRWVHGFSASADGERVALTISAPTHPEELYVLDRSSREERQLTDFNRDWCASRFLSEPEEMCYAGEGGLEIQGWLMRPMGFDPAQRYPLAVEIHGGPQTMWGATFFHEFQVLASRGYFVFFCNPRGSSGYGRQFQLERKKGGYTDAPDIVVAGVNAVLAQEPAVDAERLVVTGGSYGGFLTGWIVTHYTHFKAAVSQRGVYDELNMFGSGDIPECVEWYHRGIPRLENLEELWEYSPAAHAENVVTPLMILHSELDYRVPVSQAETFFAHLRRRGNRNTVMVRYPREGHELSRGGEPLHRVDRLYKILGWFDRHVQPQRLDPPALDAATLEGWLTLLPGWSLEGAALVRCVACGTQGIAQRMAARVVELAREIGHAPATTARGADLVLEVGRPAAGGVTERDIHLARMINARLFRH